MICKVTIAELVQRSLQNNGYHFEAFTNGAFILNVINYLECFEDDQELLDTSLQILADLNNGEDEKVIDSFL